MSPMDTIIAINMIKEEIIVKVKVIDFALK